MNDKTSMIRHAIESLADGYKGSARGSKERICALIASQDHDNPIMQYLMAYQTVNANNKLYGRIARNDEKNIEGNNKFDPYGIGRITTRRMYNILQSIQNKIVKDQLVFRDKLIESEDSIDEVVNGGYDIYEFLSDQISLDDIPSLEGLEVITNSDYEFLSKLAAKVAGWNKRYELNDFVYYARWDYDEEADIWCITETAENYKEAVELCQRASEEWIVKNTEAQEAAVGKEIKDIKGLASIFMNSQLAVNKRLEEMADDTLNPEKLLIEEEEKVA